MAVRIEADTQKYLPFDTGTTQNTTEVIGNLIVYPAPHSRYLYYGKVMVDAATGKGPMRIVDEIGNEYIRFHKGAKLIPTSRNLEYDTTKHPKAGAFWYERSKADNLDTWIREMRDDL